MSLDWKFPYWGEKKYDIVRAFTTIDVPPNSAQMISCDIETLLQIILEIMITIYLSIDSNLL